MDFPKELLSPQKVIFKKGAVAELAREALEFGPAGLIVHGGSLERNGVKDKILRDFGASNRIAWFQRGEGEPTLDEISRVIEKARSVEADWIAGIGGGSVMDLAKAAAGLYHASERPVYYQEGGVFKERGIPFLAAPTTAGTGTEATINSVIINPEKKAKLSLRDKNFLARKVILDPDLLKGLPRVPMGYSAMDALAQAYESYTSRHATWYSDTLALKAVGLMNKHLLPAIERKADKDLSAILLASYLTGVAFGSSRLGVIHGVAHPLGVLYGVPHGLICAVCLIPSARLNQPAIGKKYDMLSEAVGKDFIERVDELLGALKITSPFRQKKLIGKEKIIQETLRSGSTAANPKQVVREDVEYILGEIFERAEQ